MEKNTIYTIGFTKKSLKKFIDLLKRTGVTKVVDIRLNNTSHLAGFAKGEDLEFLLKEGLGIEYEYMPIFAPTKEILGSYRRDKDWDRYEDRYSKLLKDKDITKIKNFIDRDSTICLLCSKDLPDKCH